MSDILKIIDELKNKTHLSWAVIALLAVFAVLAYEIAKQLLPKFFEYLARTISTVLRQKNSGGEFELDIQRFCRVSRGVNWANSLPSISRYGLDIPIDDVFVFPRVALHNGTGAVMVRPIGEILSSHRTLCITGAPSSGKSTLISFLAVTFANETAPDNLGLLESRLPLCFNFKEFIELGEGHTISEVISLLYKRRGVAINSKFIEEALRNGRCALLLDGLDEMGDRLTRKKTFGWIMESMASYSENNRIIITCRDFEWEQATFPGIPRAIIQAYSEDDAILYVHKFRDSVLSRTPADGRELVFKKFSELLDGLVDDYHFLASSPLLLTLAVSLLTLNIPVPKRRADVLATFVKAMLRDWNTVKGLPDTNLSSERVDKILQNLAYLALGNTIETGALSLDNHDVVNAIPHDYFSAREWLDLVASQSGILSKITDMHWVFSNRRILEYLAAEELHRHPNRWKQLWGVPDWKEVFGFMPEIAAAGTDYFNWIDRQGQPATLMHAVMVLKAALALPDSSHELRDRLISFVRIYLNQARTVESVIDGELLRLYIKADWQTFIVALSNEFETHNMPEDPVHSYASWAILSGNVYASQYVADRIKDMSWIFAKRTLEMLIYAPVRSRASIVRAAFFSDLKVGDISPPLVGCGADVLKIIIDIAQNESYAGYFSRAVQLIAQFPEAEATQYLFKIKNIGGKSSNIVQRAIEDHFAVLYARSSVNLVKILLRAKSTFYTQFGKRVFDILFSTTTLIFLAPIFIVLAIAIKIESDGPIFFRSPRVGLKGNRFYLYRFRSVKIETNDKADRVVTQASRHDTRITRVGAFLRRTSLDELPQLFNVMRGEMSMVGPRPLPLEFMELTTLRHSMLDRFRPGVMSASQINYRRSGSAYLGAIQFSDLSYMANCTCRGDLKIMLLFFLKTMRSSNAY